MKYKRCEQNRRDCFACKGGKCRVLNNTRFIRPLTGKTYKCPFYKKVSEVSYETLVALESEEETNEED